MSGKVIFTTGSHTGEFGTDADGNIFINTHNKSKKIIFDGVKAISGSLEEDLDKTTGKVIKQKIKDLTTGKEFLRSGSAVNNVNGQIEMEQNTNGAFISVSGSSQAGYNILKAADSEKRYIRSTYDSMVNGDAEVWTQGMDAADGDFVFTTVIAGTSKAQAKLIISRSGDLYVPDGDIIANNYIVSSSQTNMTVAFASGSTMFGDTITDTHLFTGSIDTTGSLTVKGAISASGNLYLDGGITASANSYINDSVDGGDVAFEVRNSAGGGSTDETSTLKFGTSGTLLTAKIVGGRDGTYASAAASDGNLQFYTRLNNTDTEYMRITSDGKVGIGTATPSKTLEVAGDISASGEIWLKDDSKIQWEESDNYIKGTGDALSIDSDNIMNFYADTRFIFHDANVGIGIGNANPPKTLTVAGEISSSGGFHGGGTYATGSYDFPGAIMGYTVLGEDATSEGNYNLTTSYATINASTSVTFVAPKSGKVEIHVQTYWYGGSGGSTLYFGLSDAASYNAVHAKYENLVTDSARFEDYVVTHKWVLTGLNAAQSYQYWIGGKVSSTTGTPYIKWGGDASDEFAPFIIKVTALPSNISEA
tara:strand:+ start:720 stop:2492 length:1773 start_codon:yes stop_codon:yes gene_type:complete